MKRFEYKKVIGFTLQQKRAFEEIKSQAMNTTNLFSMTANGYA